MSSEGLEATAEELEGVLQSETEEGMPEESQIGF